MSGFADFLINHHLPQVVTSSEQAAGEDMFNGNITTDVYNGSAWEGSIFTVIKLAGAVGTATVTCESCSAADGSNNTAVAFRYRKATTPDTFTAWTDVTSSGQTIAAGADEIWEFAIAHSDGYKGTSTAPVNYQYFRWVATEVDGTAVDGTAFVMLIGPKYGHEIPGTVLT